MVDGRLPDFVIVGAMRSGTTSLWRYLGDHPEVFMTSKELGFFTDHYSKGVDWYRRQYAAAGDGQILGEATADYLARRSTHPRLRQLLPEAQMIATLRHPVERAWSHYWLLRERGREKRRFEDVVEVEIEDLEEDPTHDAFTYLAHGLYDVHFQSLLSHFPADQLHVVTFETLVTDPGLTFAELCDFLAIDRTYVPDRLGEPVNRYVSLRSLWLRNASRRLSPVLENIIGKLNSRRVDYPQMDEATRLRLERFYKPHIEALETTLGRDFGVWKSATP